MADLIQDKGFEVAADVPFTFAYTLPGSRQASEWASFTLTVREDPKWPRGGTAAGLDRDPIGDGWAVMGTAPGVRAAGQVVEFDFATGLPPGRHRYALDVKGTGGTAGEARPRPAAYLTVLPGVTS